MTPEFSIVTTTAHTTPISEMSYVQRAQRDSNPQPFDPKSRDATGTAQGSASVRDEIATSRDSRHTKTHTKSHPRIRPLWLDCPTPRDAA
jgi:hypothetical protein